MHPWRHDLDGRVVLVTGAPGGVGRLLVPRLCAAGATVVTAGPPPGDPTHGEHVDADLADLAGLPALVTEVEDRYGRIDVLLPDAGTRSVPRLDELALDEWQQLVATNLSAPFLLTRAAAPGMRDRGVGRVLFTPGATALTGGFVGPHYAATRAGLHGLVHSLSTWLAPSGVTVNAIAPALVEEAAVVADHPGRPRRRADLDKVADLALSVLANAEVSGYVLLVDDGTGPPRAT